MKLYNWILSALFLLIFALVFAAGWAAQVEHTRHVAPSGDLRYAP